MNPQKRPMRRENCLINQVGCHGLYLGKIDFYFESKNIRVKSKVVSV